MLRRPPGASDVPRAAAGLEWAMSRVPWPASGGQCPVHRAARASNPARGPPTRGGPARFSGLGGAAGRRSVAGPREVFDEQAVAQAAVADADFSQTQFFHERIEDRRATEDDVGAIGVDAGDLAAFFQRQGTEQADHVLEMLEAEGVEAGSLDDVELSVGEELERMRQRGLAAPFPTDLTACEFKD